MSIIQSWSDHSYSFPLDGRSPEEVHEMKEYGYVELASFKENFIRKNGYFCGSCKWFEHKPMSMKENKSMNDGVCKRYSFRDRDFGCCNGWEMEPKAQLKLTILKK